MRNGCLTLEKSDSGFKIKHFQLRRYSSASVRSRNGSLGLATGCLFGTEIPAGTARLQVTSTA